MAQIERKSRAGLPFSPPATWRRPTAFAVSGKEGICQAPTLAGRESCRISFGGFQILLEFIRNTDVQTRSELKSSLKDGPSGPPFASVMPKTMSTPSWADPFEAELGRLPEKLRRFFLSRGVRTEDEACDLVQETLLRVLQRASRGEPLDSPEAYALGVAKNVFFEYCRRVRKANRHEGLSGILDLAGAEDPLSDALSSSRRLIVRKALELLPRRMKDLLVRRFVEEVPSRTIAREEGITTDAVDMRVYRAKRELRRKMDSSAARSAPRASREEDAKDRGDEGNRS